MRIKIVIDLYILIQNFRNISNIHYLASLTPTETKNAFNNLSCKFLCKYCPFTAIEADAKSESKNYNPAATALSNSSEKHFQKFWLMFFSPGLRGTFKLLCLLVLNLMILLAHLDWGWHFPIISTPSILTGPHISLGDISSLKLFCVFPVFFLTAWSAALTCPAE